MFRKLSAAALVALLASAQPAATALAATPGQTMPAADVRAKVDRAGLGEKARVTVWTGDGRKIKGYVAERRDGEFVVRDRKTDAASVVPYADVTKLDINRGHSTARNVSIGAAVGVGALIATVGILVAVLGGD
jgi:hypothetical protein